MLLLTMTAKGILSCAPPRFVAELRLRKSQSCVQSCDAELHASCPAAPGTNEAWKQSITPNLPACGKDYEQPTAAPEKLCGPPRLLLRLNLSSSRSDAHAHAIIFIC